MATSPGELADLLRVRRDPIRLQGTGTRQDRLPDPGGAEVIDLSSLDSIERLDAEDLTCSVGVGLRREVLDEALRARNVCLPCVGSGTLGGLFAFDPIGPTSVGGPCPRSLLLGLEGVLTDGTVFRSGARVVKNVAGFDLHKAFVGSRGRLFAATTLHLKLRPKPHDSLWCSRTELDRGDALRAFIALRAETVPPAFLVLGREADGYCLRARLEGRPTLLRRLLEAHGLREDLPVTEPHLAAPADGEVLSGLAAPSALAALLERAPDGAPFMAYAGGHFELALPSPEATNALLPKLPEIGVHACIALGASDRRGRATPLDPGRQRLEDTLRQALDPHGILI